jgi:pimeloyl-ACP methyl ester carboxylesterase
MHYVRFGHAAPPFVFVHGFSCQHTDWKHQLDALQGTNEVVACDLRGHGATPGRPQECSIEHYGGDVAALLGNFELQRAILVGHSMGCRVVLEAARLDPARVAGIVLIDGSRLGAGDAEKAQADAREAISDPKFVQTFFAQMFREPSPLAEAVLARAMRLPEEVRVALFANMARWDAAQLDAALASVKCPLLAIQSTYTNAERRRAPLAPGQSTPWLDLLRASVPSARIEVLPGLGHFTQLEAGETINRLLRKFASQAG